MRWDIRQKPDFAIVQTTFEAPGESIVLEASAMVAKDPTVQMKTGVRGGALSALKRMVSGETLFQNEFTASRPGETLWFAPVAEGDLESYNVTGGDEIVIASSAYVASGPGVELDTKFQGMKGFFSSTKLFMVRCNGEGPVFFSGMGALHRIDLDGSTPYIVDNTHIAAFTGGLDFSIRKVGGLKSLFLSGEALVAEFRGAGTLWIATRSPGGLAGFLNPFRPVDSN